MESGLGTQVTPKIFRVMVVDDNPTCLKISARMLANHHYRVTACQDPQEAITILQEQSCEFDVVITEVHMREMSGLELLSHAKINMDLPVITMCSDNDPKITREALYSGAVFHSTKPMPLACLDTIRQKALQKRVKGRSVTSVAKKKRNVGDKSKNYENQAGEEDDHDSMGRKSRLVWDTDLHQRFLVATTLLGKWAVPTRILDLMNVDGLTSKHVASHLQKHRKRVQKVKRSDVNEQELPMMPFRGQPFFPRRTTPTISAHIFRRQNLSITPNISSPMATQCSRLLPQTDQSLTHISRAALLANRGSGGASCNLYRSFAMNPQTLQNQLSTNHQHSTPRIEDYNQKSNCAVHQQRSLGCDSYTVTPFTIYAGHMKSNAAGSAHFCNVPQRNCTASEGSDAASSSNDNVHQCISDPPLAGDNMLQASASHSASKFASLEALPSHGPPQVHENKQPGDQSSSMETADDDNFDFDFDLDFDFDPSFLEGLDDFLG